MTNIGLIGYGRMGRLIHEISAQQECNVSLIFDAHNDEHSALPDADAFAATDVLIIFTSPDAVLDSMKLAVQFNTNVVIGTTGWYRDLDAVRTMVEEAGIGALYAQNFSIGVQLFLRIVRHAAALIDAFPEYDLSIHERHHNKKADAPSGTAHKIADAILAELARKENIFTDNPDKVPQPSELYISAERVGNVPGTHSVLIDGLVDSIELTHTARSREGFAIGALNAACWMKDKSGLFTIEDMIDEIES